MFIAALLSFTILKGDDGKTLLRFSDFNLPEFELVDFSLKNFSGGWWVSKSDLPGTESTIYKWTDVDGKPQFSNSPPPQGIEYTVKKYDPNENVIPAVSPDTNDTGQGPNPESLNKFNQHGDVDSIFSPGVIEKLFEDANNVDQSQTDRNDNLDAVLGQ